ncbi:MAG TPA: IS200/IS605 family transposase [Pyrinomonadaceae bacterium]|nr:IS200/IS605 family transposase [Pyrinomonadaceae bacterium]
MPYIKVWIHLVWSTKNRIPFLTDAIRPAVFQHIRANAKEKGIYLGFLNGYYEHLHALISLGSEQTISNIVKLIKGESSHWINQNRLTKRKFAWQNDYFCVGVCESMLDKTRNYIRNQEQHHSRRGFDEEFELMLTKYGFQRFQDAD